jgi:methionyl aminopeptidase
MIVELQANRAERMREKERIGRNDPCPCGSGLKYKKCCLAKEDLSPEALKTIYLERHGIRLKDEAAIQGIRKAGRLAVETLDLVESRLRPGMTTQEIDVLVHEYTISHGAVPAPLNYRGFPKSVCVSVNEVICHGIPGDRVLKEGDILNVDVTPILNGFYADVSKTYMIGNPGPGAKKIVAVARECLKRGMETALSGKTIGDIGWAVQNYAEEQGCSVVREFVGHGVGYEFHEPPQIPHYGRRGEGVRLVPGMVFTIEPMINLGKRHLHILEDNWTAVTDDGNLSAQFEQTILITEEGYESMTPFDLS